MALSILNLFVEPGTAEVFTVWRDVVNADTVVVITVDPAMIGLSATAFTDGAGDDFGRVDVTVPSSAPPGAYVWSAEIDSVLVWEGQIFIGENARDTSYASHSVDLRSQTEPPIIVPRAEDIAGSEAVTAADQIIETGGPTTLDIDAIADGEFLRRSGTTVVGAAAILASAKGAASGVASLDANTRLVEAAQVLRVTGQSLTAGACTDGQFLTRSGTTYAGVTHGTTGDPHTQYLLRTERTYHVISTQTETSAAGGAAIAGWGSLSIAAGELIHYRIHGTYQSAGAVAAQFRLDSLSLAPAQVSGLWTIATGVTAGAAATHAVNAVNTNTANATAPAATDTSYPFEATGFIRNDVTAGTFRFRIYPSTAGTAVRVMPNSVLILERTLL